MTKQIVRLLFISPAVLFFISNENLNAQAFREQFGKNIIQYQNFDWKYYASEKFEVYYYNRGQELARQEYLETEFSRITETIGYPPFSKQECFSIIL